MEKIKGLELLEESLRRTLDAEVLPELVKMAESHSQKIAEKLAEAEFTLARMKAKSLPLKQAGVTDVDRTIGLASNVAQYQYEVDYLTYLREAVQVRVALGMVLLEKL